MHSDQPPAAGPTAVKADLFLEQPYFDTMLTTLHTWKNTYYSTIVPRTANLELAEWTSTLRRHFRKKTLPQWAIERLDAIGFMWIVDQITAKWHANFHTALDHLRRVNDERTAHGAPAMEIDDVLAFDYDDKERADLVEASRWMERQRVLYKQQKLTDMRVKLLRGMLGMKLKREYSPKRRNMHPVLKRANAKFKKEAITWWDTDGKMYTVARSIIHRTAVPSILTTSTLRSVPISIAMAPKRSVETIKKDNSTKRSKTAATARPPSAPPSSKISYFLLKSEPHVFSIDDLSNRPNQTEPWDGVRNHQAKNILAEMRIGDLGLFYASNCKEPGVVGIVEIAKESYPDATQFDPKSEYYDAKSKEDKPRWCCVDVKFIRKLDHLISLKDLRAHSDGALKDMALFRLSRLSVQRVSSEEWSFIMGLESKETNGE